MRTGATTTSSATERLSRARTSASRVSGSTRATSTTPDSYARRKIDGRSRAKDTARSVPPSAPSPQPDTPMHWPLCTTRSAT